MVNQADIPPRLRYINPELAPNFEQFQQTAESLKRMLKRVLEVSEAYGEGAPTEFEQSILNSPLNEGRSKSVAAIVIGFRLAGIKVVKFEDARPYYGKSVIDPKAKPSSYRMVCQSEKNGEQISSLGFPVTDSNLYAIMDEIGRAIPYFHGPRHLGGQMYALALQELADATKPRAPNHPKDISTRAMARYKEIFASV